MTIYLCGFMGCGKSTTGPLLAQKTGLHFTDLDDYIEEKEKSGELFVFRPEAPLPVSRTEKNPEKLKAAYEIGRQDAAARLDELKEYLKADR